MRSIKLPSWIERGLGFEPLPAPPHVFTAAPGGLVYAHFPLQDGGRRGLAAVRRASLPPDVFGSGPLGGGLGNVTAFEGAVEELLGTEPGSVDQASLVLPDEWIRLAFLEVQDLPSGRRARDEVLRWKLKRAVPVPVEDLRLSVIERPSRDEDPHRLLVGFARERLLAGMEDAFEARGIRIGRIVNSTEAVFSLLLGDRVESEPWSLVSVGSARYTLAFARGGDLALFRSKTFDAAADPGRIHATVLQDLRLTRGFILEQLGGETIREVVLVAPRAEREVWSSWIEEGFGVAPRILEGRDLPVEGSDLAVEEIAPLLGAVEQEVR